MASLAAFSTAIGAFGTIAGAALSASQANRAAELQMDAQNREYEMRARQMKLRHEIEERRRKQNLKEAVAARRARYGGAGVGAGGGSSAALLAGLRRKSAKAGAEAAEERQLGLQSNLLSVENSNRRALQRARFAGQDALLKAATGGGKGVFDTMEQSRKTKPGK